MKKITITIKGSGKDTYPIFIGEHILEKLENIVNFSKYSKVVLITDKQLEKLILKQMPQFLPEHTETIVLPFGERAKTIETVEEIWKELSRLECDRKTLIVNFGGGVITDMGGFAASTYMRGLDFINIPTTLLSQVDASVGGKTGVNFNEIKNLIGTFNQPTAVIIDVATLTTLPEKDFITGFGEIIKHAVIADKKYFLFVTSKKPQEFSHKELISIIEKSCKIKASIIQHDEKEIAKRKLLNFGHTIGHAIEILSQHTSNPLQHGEAVAIGMIAEGQISVMQNILSQKNYNILVEKIVQAGLPTKTTGISLEDVLSKILTDKKNEKGIIKFTLLCQLGNAVINQHVSNTVVKKAVETIL